LNFFLEKGLSNREIILGSEKSQFWCLGKKKFFEFGGVYREVVGVGEMREGCGWK